MRLPHRLLCLSAVSFTGWRLQQQQKQEQVQQQQPAAAAAAAAAVAQEPSHGGATAPLPNATTVRCTSSQLLCYQHCQPRQTDAVLLRLT
jgi:hypothetical protein